jgi:hypothetical protein
MKDLLHIIAIIVLAGLVITLASIFGMPQDTVINTTVINVTNTTCDLQNISTAIKDNAMITNRKIEDKECSLTLVKPYIHYYPRIQRKCKNPIDWDIYGSSMQPFLYSGDKFYVEKVRFNQLELGDVIVFQIKDATRIHAVIAIYEDFVQTAGYNLWYEDYQVKDKDILYRYCTK